MFSLFYSVKRKRFAVLVIIVDWQLGIIFILLLELLSGSWIQTLREQREFIFNERKYRLDIGILVGETVVEEERDG